MKPSSWIAPQNAGTRQHTSAAATNATTASVRRDMGCGPFIDAKYTRRCLTASRSGSDDGEVEGVEVNKFGYYKRLNARQRRIYDQSDTVTSIRLPAVGPVHDSARRLALALEADDGAATQTASQRLVDGLVHRLRVMPAQVHVLAVRPSSSREELHGQYQYGGGRQRPLITVWMRTAQRRQVVAFRSFLRTLLHEVVHHLDYQMLRLEDSYHTAGFHKRAESLYRQVTPAELQAGADTEDAGMEPDGERRASPRRTPARRRTPAARATPSRETTIPARPPRRRPRVPVITVGGEPARGRTPRRQPSRSAAKDAPEQPRLPCLDFE